MKTLTPDEQAPERQIQHLVRRRWVLVDGDPHGREELLERVGRGIHVHVRFCCSIALRLQNSAVFVLLLAFRLFRTCLMRSALPFPLSVRLPSA